jgi:uncharacterized protein
MSERNPTEAGFGPLRRKERAIESREEIDNILRSTNLMHLALTDNDRPFVVPLFFGYDGRFLYFHSAKEGTKMRLLGHNPNVCFTVSTDLGIVEADEACDFEARHRTVIGFGKACIVEDTTEKLAALDRIVSGITKRAFEYPPTRLQQTAVVRIDIVSLSGKKYGL